MSKICLPCYVGFDAFAIWPSQDTVSHLIYLDCIFVKNRNKWLYLNREQAAMACFQQIWSWIQLLLVGMLQCPCIQVLDTLLFQPETVKKYDKFKFSSSFDHLFLVGGNCYIVQWETRHINLPWELLPCDGCEGNTFK